MGLCAHACVFSAVNSAIDKLHICKFILLDQGYVHEIVYFMMIDEHQLYSLEFYEQTQRQKKISILRRRLCN